jgi:hypothetical protein
MRVRNSELSKLVISEKGQIKNRNCQTNKAYKGEMEYVPSAN